MIVNNFDKFYENILESNGWNITFHGAIRYAG